MDAPMDAPIDAPIDALAWSPARTRPGRLARLFDSKPFLVAICLLPAVGLLLVFLTYPLGLGIWLAFTDTQIGRAGSWVGLDNFRSLLDDRIFITTVWNTIFYTAAATIGKFALGLWLALLLNQHVPFKSIIRAIILLPWITPTVLSAIAFWWIYDPQFSIISYVLVDVLHWRTTYISTSSAPRGRRAGRWWPPTSGAAFRSWRSACWPVCRPSRRHSTRRPCWTGPQPGNAFA
jgi:ABC-type sugar transport system permease subunit